MGILASIGLFAAVVATWVAVSGPGEAALVSAGAVAARGEEEIAAVLAIAFAGTIAGNVVAYWLGRAGGRRLLLRPGPLLGWRTRALARSESIAQRRLRPGLDADDRRRLTGRGGPGVPPAAAPRRAIALIGERRRLSSGPSRERRSPTDAATVGGPGADTLRR